MDEYLYHGKPLSSYSLWELSAIERSLIDAEAKREEASRHSKFDPSNPKNVGKFPPPNPEFLKLKSAIEEEIRKKQNA